MHSWSSFKVKERPPKWSDLELQSIPFAFRDGEIKWGEVGEKPLEFPPSAHTQSWETITSKPLSFPPSTHAHNWASIVDPPATYTPSAHNHDAANITAGILNIGRIPTGATATTVALGNHNHTFANLNGVAITTPATNQALKFNGTNWVNGSINWGEIQNTPATFTPTPFSFIEFAENSVNYLDFHVQGVSKSSVDFDARIACFLEAGLPVANSFANLQYQAYKHLFYGSIFFFGLPTSANGLQSGQVWRDSNGFLRGLA